jgi:surface antigen
MKWKFVSAVVISYLLLSGCENFGEEAGRLASVPFAIVMSPLVGEQRARAFVDEAGERGAQLFGGKLSDRARAARETALKDAITQPGTTRSWAGPDSDDTGMIQARAIPTQDGRTCYEIDEEVRVAGENQRVFSTVCRTPEGTWKIE